MLEELDGEDVSLRTSVVSVRSVDLGRSHDPTLFSAFLFKMHSPTCVPNSDTEVDESPNILGPTPTKQRSLSSKRRLEFSTGRTRDKLSFASFDRDLLLFSTPISADATRVGPYAEARAMMAKSAPTAAPVPRKDKRKDPISLQPGLPLFTSTPTTPPVNYGKTSTSESVDSGVCDKTPDVSTSLQTIIAQLQDSNKHMKELTKQMKDIDKRVQTLEQEDADDEGDGGLDKKKAKKRKCKANGPSKDVRVGRWHANI